MRDFSNSGGVLETTASSAMASAHQFVRARWARVLSISAAVLLPCLWQRHIQGGDYASHIYNAWLAQLIRAGKAPGLYIVHQWNNILVDLALDRVSSLLGFAAAEKIVACVCVLIFFWGAFALITAATRRPPWVLAPAVAMVAYGWTFQLGFMNYYLAIGLAGFALAIFWRARGADWFYGAVVALIVLVAHPMVFVWLVAAACYVKISE
ncbi:MAG TPA: hypothetical protein VE077_14230, partial [Candidatus Methylomirabilis sp.]|nr:hypothetical protein [Candidatus Methylomirabilis sp.]